MREFVLGPAIFLLSCFAVCAGKPALLECAWRQTPKGKMNRSYFARLLRPLSGFENLSFGIVMAALQNAADSGVIVPSRETMAVRLQSILADAEVSTEVQDQLADAGITSLGLFASMGDSDKAVREFLADVVGLDPAGETDRAIRAKVRMEITRICSAYGVSKASHEVEIKANAERSSQMLPVIVSKEEFTACRNAFEKCEYKLVDEIAPSKPFFERKVTELSNEFIAEHLTTVTTTTQEEASQHQIPQIDPKTGFFRMSTKTLGIEMPRDTEEYRLRWETLGICLWYVKARSASRRVLQTVTMSRHDSILKWLFGPEVWGLATRTVDGTPLSTPSMQHVFTYEFALRKSVAKQMNGGVTWWDVWQVAMADVRLRQTHNITFSNFPHSCKCINEALVIANVLLCPYRQQR